MERGTANGRMGRGGGRRRGNGKRGGGGRQRNHRSKSGRGRGSTSGVKDTGTGQSCIGTGQSKGQRSKNGERKGGGQKRGSQRSGRPRTEASANEKYFHKYCMRERWKDGDPRMTQFYPKACELKSRGFESVCDALVSRGHAEHFVPDESSCACNLVSYLELLTCQQFRVCMDKVGERYSAILLHVLKEYSFRSWVDWVCEDQSDGWECRRIGGFGRGVNHGKGSLRIPLCRLLAEFLVLCFDRNAVKTSTMLKMLAQMDRIADTVRAQAQQTVSSLEASQLDTALEKLRHFKRKLENPSSYAVGQSDSSSFIMRTHEGKSMIGASRSGGEQLDHIPAELRSFVRTLPARYLHQSEGKIINEDAPTVDGNTPVVPDIALLLSENAFVSPTVAETPPLLSGYRRKLFLCAQRAAFEPFRQLARALLHHTSTSDSQAKLHGMKWEDLKSGRMNLPFDKDVLRSSVLRGVTFEDMESKYVPCMQCKVASISISAQGKRKMDEKEWAREEFGSNSLCMLVRVRREAVLDANGKLFWLPRTLTKEDIGFVCFPKGNIDFNTGKDTQDKTKETKERSKNAQDSPHVSIRLSMRMLQSNPSLYVSLLNSKSTDLCKEEFMLFHPFKHFWGPTEDILRLIASMNESIPFTSAILEDEYDLGKPRAGSSLECPAYMRVWADNGYEVNFDAIAKDGKRVRYCNAALLSQPHRLYQHLCEYKENIKLDDGQLHAFVCAICSTLGVIVGPPGTGKSYVGVQLAAFLLSNFRESRRMLRKSAIKRIPSQIVCICVTKHAVEQFLEKMLESNIVEKKDIVYLGWPKNEELLNECKLPRQLEQACIGKAAEEHRRILSKQRYIYKDLLEESLEAMRLMEQAKAPNAKEKIVTEIAEAANDCTSSLNELIRRRDESKILADDKVDELKREVDGIIDDISPLLDLDTQQNDGDWRHTSQPTRLLTQYHRRFLVSKHRQWRHVLLRVLRYAAQGAWRVNKRLLNYHTANKAAYIKTKRVIACTVSKFAMEHSMLTSALNNAVFIVEEAGEILEAQQVPCLPRNGKVAQCVLIGDPLQLRPRCDVYNMARESGRGVDYDVSLMERMVVYRLREEFALYPGSSERKGTLNTSDQFAVGILRANRRMRPEIAGFVRSVYPRMEDDPSTKQRNQRVLGVRTNVWFWDNNGRFPDNRQASGNARDNVNQSEAHMICAFAGYLTRNGVSGERITILSAYLPQLFHIMKTIPKYVKGVQTTERDREDFLKKGLITEEEAKELAMEQRRGRGRSVLVSTIDSYQGEENDLILISTVRCNKQGRIGFLEVQNRVVVLLSRARRGMYLFGCAKTITKNYQEKYRRPYPPLLYEAVQRCRGTNCLESYLPLCCQQHEKLTKVARPEDFKLVENGGCGSVCGKELQCGHKCAHKCHPLDLDHGGDYRCNRRCEKFAACPSGQHDNENRCTQRCGRVCSKCPQTVERELVCGHTRLVKCTVYQNEDDVKQLLAERCKQMVKGVLSCGHNKRMCCWKRTQGNFQGMKCNERVQMPLLCGHFVKVPCHILTLAKTCPPKKRLPLFRKYSLACKQRCGRPCVDCYKRPAHACGDFCGTCTEGALNDEVMVSKLCERWQSMLEADNDQKELQSTRLPAVHPRECCLLEICERVLGCGHRCEQGNICHALSECTCGNACSVGFAARVSTERKEGNSERKDDNSSESSSSGMQSTSEQDGGRGEFCCGRLVKLSVVTGESDKPVESVGCLADFSQGAWTVVMGDGTIRESVDRKDIKLQERRTGTNGACLSEIIHQHCSGTKHRESRILCAYLLHPDHKDKVSLVSSPVTQPLLQSILETRTAADCIAALRSACAAHTRCYRSLDSLNAVRRIITDRDAMFAAFEPLDRDCYMCFADEIPQDEGIECSFGHFLCNECVPGWVRDFADCKDGEWDVEKFAKQQGKLGCDYGDCGHIFDHMRVLRCVRRKDEQDELLTLLMKARVEVDVRRATDELKKANEIELERRLRAKLLKSQDQRDVEAFHQHIASDILCLRCPKCRGAFVDFSGCFALTCHCGCKFCAWCLKDCGADAHPHVRVCTSSQQPGVFGSEEVFNSFHVQRRGRLLEAYLRETVPPRLWSRLYELCRKDLADLGLEKVFDKLQGTHDNTERKNR